MGSATSTTTAASMLTPDGGQPSVGQARHGSGSIGHRPAPRRGIGPTRRAISTASLGTVRRINQSFNDIKTLKTPSPDHREIAFTHTSSRILNYTHEPTESALIYMMDSSWPVFTPCPTTSGAYLRGVMIFSPGRYDCI